MNRSTTALLATAPLLLALVGCASSPHRLSAKSNPGSVPSLHETKTTPAPAIENTHAQTAMNDEMIIGSTFASDEVPFYPEPISHFTLDQIRAELEEMYDLDQQLVRAAYTPDLDPQTAHTIHAIDKAHSDRLKEIVEHIGWPTRSLVGLKATQGAYMVIQHAGHDIEFQNQCLEKMVDLVEAGELPASYLALLTDRIRMFQNRPQVFGTQMTMSRDEHGVLVPTPTVEIEDPEHLDERRAMMGMAPHEQFVLAIQVAYEASLEQPGTAFAEVPEEK